LNLLVGNLPSHEWLGYFRKKSAHYFVFAISHEKTQRPQRNCFSVLCVLLRQLQAATFPGAEQELFLCAFLEDELHLILRTRGVENLAHNRVNLLPDEDDAETSCLSC